MGRWIAAAASVAVGVACGRLGFEERIEDAGGNTPIDAAPQVPGLVAMTGSSTGDSATVASLQVAIAQVHAGNLIVVAVAEHHGDTVASIVDDAGHLLTSAGARAVNGSTASELWYESAAIPASAVTVTTDVASNFDVWVAEFSGTRPGPPASVAGDCLQYPPTMVTVPGMTTVANDLVVTTLMAEFPLFVSAALPPFTAFPPLTGNGAAYYVAPQPGSYGAVYGIASGDGMPAMTCASTAVWLPGP